MCFDRVQNGSETDVDCGGECEPCGAGLACDIANDCQAPACEDGTCAAPSCTDGVTNGFEADVDCGGICDACPRGPRCDLVSDCESEMCTDGRCL